MSFLIKTTISILLGFTVALSLGCSKEGGHTAAGNAAATAGDEKAIRDLVTQTVAAAGRKDMDTYLRFYGPDPALVLPGIPIKYGVDTTRKNGFPEGYAIKMDTAKVEIASAGDLGYAFGTYEQTAPDAKTHALADTTGKWMSVFRKQADGSWGAVADTFNVDPGP
jgi:ketosteroid isomerase-like protein